MSAKTALTARPRLPGGGHVPACVPYIELNRPRMAEPRVSIKRREEVDAAAEFDRICAARPTVPPPLPKHNDTRTAGACALAKEIRLGDYEP